MQKIAQAAIVAALGLLVSGTKANAQSISVMVNGQAVSFNGTQPQEVNGSVLVPLRGVFEQLGATVIYNPATKTIYADKGAKNVSLTLGSSTAYVNSQPQQLAQAPAVMDGTTLVPLRFVAESFGAYVGWEAASNTVDINTDQEASVPAPDQGTTSQVSSVTGRVTDIDNTSSPAVMTIGTQSGPVEANINDHTRFTLREHNLQVVPSAEEALHVGDHVTAQLWANGNARSVEIKSAPDASTAISGSISGIDNVNDPSLITIDTDSGAVQVGIDSHTNVIRIHANGDTETLSADSLHVGDHITASLRANGSARSIKITYAEHNN